jgi:hypothetical protein
MASMPGGQTPAAMKNQHANAWTTRKSQEQELLPGHIACTLIVARSKIDPSNGKIGLSDAWNYRPISGR